ASDTRARGGQLAGPGRARGLPSWPPCCIDGPRRGMTRAKLARCGLDDDRPGGRGLTRVRAEERPPARVRTPEGRCQSYRRRCTPPLLPPPAARFHSSPGPPLHLARFPQLLPRVLRTQYCVLGTGCWCSVPDPPPPSLPLSAPCVPSAVK